MNLASVRDVDPTCPASDRGQRCQAEARQSAIWPRRARGLALALALLVAAVALTGGRPVWAATGPTADLVLTMVATPLSVPVGGEITYRMDVTNQGPNLAANVILRDPLPTGLEFVAASTSKGTSYLNVRTLVCQLGALDVGETAVVTLVGHLSQMQPLLVPNERP